MGSEVAGRSLVGRPTVFLSRFRNVATACPLLGRQAPIVQRKDIDDPRVPAEIA